MTDLSDVDRAALELAIEVTRRESPGRRQQIDSFLTTREWIYVATFCAGCAQSRSLRLPPWQPSPCFVGDMAAALANTDEQSGYRAAALLRQRMERCGVSRWHPNPVAACEAAEAEQRQAATRSPG
jgi:predicted acylesterase/phospholipase RssA